MEQNRQTVKSQQVPQGRSSPLAVANRPSCLLLRRARSRYPRAASSCFCARAAAAGEWSGRVDVNHRISFQLNQPFGINESRDLHDCINRANVLEVFPCGPAPSSSLPSRSPPRALQAPGWAVASVLLRGPS